MERCRGRGSRTSPAGRLHFPNVGGLLKKSYELSVLYIVEVEIMIFSLAGKLYEMSFSENFTILILIIMVVKTS